MEEGDAMEVGDAVEEGDVGELDHGPAPEVEQVHPDPVQNLVVRLRGGDGADFPVLARALAAVAAGFVFPFPAIRSERVYRLVQEYAVTYDAFTDPHSGQPLPGLQEATRDIIVNIGADHEDVDTLGHLAKAAISLRIAHLLALCMTRLYQLPVDPHVIMVLLEVNGMNIEA